MCARTIFIMGYGKNKHIESVATQTFDLLYLTDLTAFSVLQEELYCVYKCLTKKVLTKAFFQAQTNQKSLHQSKKHHF